MEISRDKLANTHPKPRDGSLQYSCIEVGFRNAVRVTDALTTGKTFATSSGFTLDTGLAAGNTYAVYNNSASAITITQGTGVTLRLNGTSTTGSLSLAARGLCTIWANSTSEYVASGPLS